MARCNCILMINELIGMYRCSYQLWHVSSRIKLWEPKRVSNGTNTMGKTLAMQCVKVSAEFPRSSIFTLLVTWRWVLRWNVPKSARHDDYLILSPLPWEQSGLSILYQFSSCSRKTIKVGVELLWTMNVLISTPRLVELCGVLEWKMNIKTHEKV